MNHLGYFILGAILVGMVILAAPLSFGYDSTERRVKLTFVVIKGERYPSRRLEEAGPLTPSANSFPKSPRKFWPGGRKIR